REDKIAAANEMSGALGRLLAIAEQYPDLKANQQFARLSDELAGTENRIAVERMRYNDAVREYNAYIKAFPTVLYAESLGFKPEKSCRPPPAARRPPGAHSAPGPRGYRVAGAPATAGARQSPVSRGIFSEQVGIDGRPPAGVFSLSQRSNEPPAARPKKGKE